MHFYTPVQTGLNFMNNSDINFANDPEFIKMMEDFERELENLSPEERRQFDEMVNEFARVIQEMPEEEFNQLLQDINADFAMAESAPVIDTAPEIHIPAPVVQLIIPDEIKGLAETLQNIRTYLSVFLIKIQIAPELSLKIDKWIQQEKIQYAPEGYTWNQGTYDIEKFSALISSLLETDKNMNPVFLFEIHKDGNLENILNELAKQLTIIPSINIVEFGFKQEKETSEQIKQILSYILEAFFRNDILAKLDLIFKAHQHKVPESAKIRDEFSPSSQPYPQTSTIESPYQSNYYDYNRIPQDEYDLYNDYVYDNYYGNQDRYYPSHSSGYDYYDYDESRNLPFNEDDDRSGRRGGPRKNENNSTEGKIKKEESSKTEKADKKDLKSVSAEFQKQISEITTTIVNNTNIDSFEKYLKNDEIKFTVQNSIGDSEVINQKIKDTTKTATELLRLIEEEKQPKKAIKKIQDKVKKEITELESFNEKLSAIVSNQTKYSLEKRFGHFDDFEALQAIRKTNPKRAKELEGNQDQYISMDTLSKNCHKLIETLQPFIKKEENEKIAEEEYKERIIPEKTETQELPIEGQELISENPDE